MQFHCCFSMLWQIVCNFAKFLLFIIKSKICCLIILPLYYHASYIITSHFQSPLRFPKTNKRREFAVGFVLLPETKFCPGLSAYFYLPTGNHVFSKTDPWLRNIPLSHSLVIIHDHIPNLIILINHLLCFREFFTSPWVSFSNKGLWFWKGKFVGIS